MANDQVESNNKTKVEAVFSAEELEALIAQVDPEFNSAVQDIESDHSKSELNIELINIDDIMRLDAEKTLMARFRRFKKTAYAKLIQFSAYLKTSAVSLVQASIEILKTLLKKFGDKLHYFRYLPLKIKLAFFMIIFLSIGTSFYFYKAVTAGWIGHTPPLFVSSLEEWATDSYSFESDENMEPFYDSPRVAQNLFALKRLVVNIRRSENSGPNPMAAFEFYLEGSAAEVIVEVKDRESEIRDHFQRTIEEMSFDQLSTRDGKQLMLEKLRREINKLTTQGQIRKIFIKTIIIKP